MTLEDCMGRLEHVTPAWFGPWRREREEDRQLWRDTQRQINELSVSVPQMGDELREAGRRLGERLDQFRAGVADRDCKLDARIGALVSSVAKLASKE